MPRAMSTSVVLLSLIPPSAFLFYHLQSPQCLKQQLVCQPESQIQGNKDGAVTLRLPSQGVQRNLEMLSVVWQTQPILTKGWGEQRQA